MQSLGRNKYDESIVISVMFLHSPLTLSSISLRHLSLALVSTPSFTEEWGRVSLLLHSANQVGQCLLKLHTPPVRFVSHCLAYGLCYEVGGNSGCVQNVVTTHQGTCE